MANFMPGEYNLPASDAAQVEQINRRRQFADALRKQQDPQGQMVSGVYVAPSITQHLATLLNKYQAGSIDRDSDKQIQDIYGNRQKTVQSAQQRLIDALKPKQVQDGETSTMPAYTPDQMDQFGSPLPNVQREPIKTPTYKTVTPGPQDLMQAQLEYAQSIGDPNAMNQALQSQLGYQVQQQTREDTQKYKTQETQMQREFLKQQAEEARAQRQQEILLKMQDSRTQAAERADLQRELAKMQIDSRRDMAAMTAGNRSPVQVLGPDGNAVYVPPNQAIGMRPYNAKQEAADAAKVQSQQQAAISSQQALDQAAALFQHPGKSIGTGWTSSVSSIPGTDARGFKANLDTFKAQTFIPMVSALKGMGALSDAEGKKLSDSIGALDPGMKTEEFDKSLKQITKTLYDKAKTNGLNVSLPEFAMDRASDKSKPSAGGGVKRYNPATGRIE